MSHQVLFHDVPCRLCYKSICPEGYHACLSQVEPQAVVAAVLELLFMEQFKLAAPWATRVPLQTAR